MKATHEDHTEFLLYLVWIHDEVGNLFLYCKNVGRHAREFAPHAMVI